MQVFPCEGTLVPLCRPRKGNAVIEIIVVLVICGVVLYLVNQYVPMAPPIKTIVNVLVVLLLCLWLLNAFGIVNVPLRLR